MLRMKEEPNRAAKKNVFDVSTQRGHKTNGTDIILHMAQHNLKNRKITTTKCQQLYKKKKVGDAHLQPGNDNWYNGGAKVHHQTFSN